MGGAKSGSLLSDHLKDVNVLDIACGPNFNLVNEVNHAQKYRRVWSWGAEVSKKTIYYDDDYIKHTEDRDLPLPLGRDKDDEIHAIPELYKKEIVQITCGASHAAALTQEGDVYTWGTYRQGMNDLGMRASDVDLNSPVPVDEPEIVEELLPYRIVQIASAANVTYALAENGDVYQWGAHRASSQFTVRTVQNALTPITVRFPSSKVCAIFANSNSDNVFAVTRRGKVYGWGPNESFQVAHEVEKPMTTAQRKKVAAANKKKKAGKKGNFGPRHSDHYYIPVECNAIEQVVPIADEVEDLIAIGNITAISSGKKHGALVTKDGKVFCWGSNEFGQCGGSDDDYVIPNEVDVPSKAVDVVCGANFTVVVTEDSNAYGWGLGENGRLGPKGKKVNRKPVKVNDGIDGDVEIAAAGKKHVLLAVSNK